MVFQVYDVAVDDISVYGVSLYGITGRWCSRSTFPVCHLERIKTITHSLTTHCKITPFQVLHFNCTPGTQRQVKSSPDGIGCLGPPRRHTIKLDGLRKSVAHTPNPIQHRQIPFSTAILQAWHSKPSGTALLPASNPPGKGTPCMVDI